MTYYEGHCIGQQPSQRKLSAFDALPPGPPKAKRNTKPAKRRPSPKQKTQLKASSIKPETSKGTETYAANLDGAKAKAEKAFGNCESDFTSPLDKAMFGNPGFSKKETKSSRTSSNTSDRNRNQGGRLLPPSDVLGDNARVQELVSIFRSTQQGRAPGIGEVF